MTETKKRSDVIAQQYFDFLDQHIEDVVKGDITEFFELKQIASELNISHSHLSDTLRQSTGHHPCYFYDQKIINKAKILLEDNTLSIAGIAKMLTYDPSNFGKFFKKITGKTAGDFRKEILI